MDVETELRYEAGFQTFVMGTERAMEHRKTEHRNTPEQDIELLKKLKYSVCSF